MRASFLGKGQIIPVVIRPQDLSRYSLIRLLNAMVGFGEIEIPVTLRWYVGGWGIFCRCGDYI